jgi:hypothetical protein
MKNYHFLNLFVLVGLLSLFGCNNKDNQASTDPKSDVNAVTKLNFDSLLKVIPSINVPNVLDDSYLKTLTPVNIEVEKQFDWTLKIKNINAFNSLKSDVPSISSNLEEKNLYLIGKIQIDSGQFLLFKKGSGDIFYYLTSFDVKKQNIKKCLCISFKVGSQSRLSKIEKDGSLMVRQTENEKDSGMSSLFMLDGKQGILSTSDLSDSILVE